MEGEEESSLVKLRKHIRKSDLKLIEEIVASSGMFTSEEIEIAREVVKERLKKGYKSRYFFIFAELDDKIIGYACYGPVAGSAGSYDLYWIVVDKAFQGKGVGKILIMAVEKAVKQKGGRRIFVETSSKDLYRPTQNFYRGCGYKQEALLHDFYGPGDHKVIFSKAFMPSKTDFQDAFPSGDTEIS